MAASAMTTRKDWSDDDVDNLPDAESTEDDDSTDSEVNFYGNIGDGVSSIMDTKFRLGRSVSHHNGLENASDYHEVATAKGGVTMINTCTGCENNYAARCVVEALPVDAVQTKNEVFIASTGSAAEGMAREANFNSQNLDDGAFSVDASMLLESGLLDDISVSSDTTVPVSSINEAINEALSVDAIETTSRVSVASTASADIAELYEIESSSGLDDDALSVDLSVFSVDASATLDSSSVSVALAELAAMATADETELSVDVDGEATFVGALAPMEGTLISFASTSDSATNQENFDGRHLSCVGLDGGALSFDASPTIEDNAVGDALADCDTVEETTPRLKRAINKGDGLIEQASSPKRARSGGRPTSLDAHLHWEECFRAYVQYCQHHGCSKVPQKPSLEKSRGWSNSLKVWYMKQGRYFRTNNAKYMTPERIERLNRIGFDWGRSKDRFDEIYPKLKEFFGIVGHSDFHTTALEKATLEKKLEFVLRKLDPNAQETVDAMNNVRLGELLSDEQMPRRVSSLREQYHAWKSIVASSAKETAQLKWLNKKWTQRVKKLDKLNFNYSLQVSAKKKKSKAVDP